jgi:tetratricopeptide (TPR) repeat protein
MSTVMIGQLLDGRYQIDQVLSNGGFGQTFLAKDIKRPGHPLCVVKQLRCLNNNPQQLQIARRLFKQEAEILEKLGKHEQIPTLLADLEENQEFYLVQEFISGHTLSEELLPGQPWSEDKTINFLKEVLAILVFVHEHGVIHRDIKPANIMRRDLDKKLVLIDFGAVKEIISTQISQGQYPPTISIGTPGYIPIEQMHGQPQLNSDIYAVGMIAIQALLGIDYQELRQLPEPNTNQVRWRHRGQVSPALADVIDKMVLPGYMRRYQSAGEVLADLAKITAVSRVPKVFSTISSLTQKTRLSQFNKRQRLIFAGVAALVVVGGLMGIFYSQSPRLAQYFLDRGVEKGKKGDNAGAVENYNWAIWLNSKNATAYFNRGVIRDHLGDKQGAIEDYTRAIKIKPNFAGSYLNRGVVRDRLGDKQGAIEDYTKAIKIKPNSPEAYSKRGVVRGSDLGDYTGAIDDFTQAIQINPKFALAYTLRGIVRFQHGDYTGAIDDSTQAIQINPKDTIAYTNKCLAHINLSQHQKAVEDCTKALELDSKIVQAYNNRGLAHTNLGKHQKAIEDLTKAININPNYFQAYLNRGLAHRRLNNYREAIKDYNQVLRLNPKVVGAYQNRGATRFLLGDKQGAIDDYTQAIKLKPDYAPAYYNRGFARAELGDQQEAIKDLQQAAKLFAEQGLTGGYNLAQKELKKLQQGSSAATPSH